MDEPAIAHALELEAKWTEAEHEQERARQRFLDFSKQLPFEEQCEIERRLKAVGEQMLAEADALEKLGKPRLRVVPPRPN